MIYFVSLLILAFAVSLDSFGVGITYGMRKVLIPIRSILIIALCSGIMILVSMGFGHGISYFLSPEFAEFLGGIILILIGSWALYNIFRTSAKEQDQIPKKEEKPSNKESIGEHENNNEIDKRYIWTVEFKKFGIVIQILRTPMVADIDRSGTISGMEAFVLGVALALDAFGAGLGASLMGYSPWITAVVIATMSSLFVFLGMKFGQLFSDTKWIKKVSFLPGIILITFGLIKLF